MLSPATRLGPCEIVAPIGAGGMGEVYRAYDTRLHRDVAIKVLPAHLADDADRRQRFQREARAVAALSHPSVVAIHDVGAEGSTVYAVMELLDGETLGAGGSRRRTRRLAVTGKARAIVAEMEEWSPRVNRAYANARVYAVLGELDQAFAWLRQSAEDRDSHVTWVGLDFIFAELRQDPRYAAFVREVGLPH
jgi:aminoglycoside phosphotransferase (APT) family kinase protein